MDPRIAQALRDARIPVVSPGRSNGAASKSERDNGFPGDNSVPGTRAANTVQQQYFAPVSNADIAVTLAHALRFELPKNGHLTGRIIDEALAGGRRAFSLKVV